MPYVPQSQIERQRDLVQQLTNPQRPATNIGTGLSQIINKFRGAKLSKDLTAKEAENQRIEQQEIQQLLRVLGGGAGSPAAPQPRPNLGASQAGSPSQRPQGAPQIPSQGQQYQSPRAQQIALQAAIQRQKQQGGERFSQSPIYTRGPEDKIGVVQLSSKGGFRPSQGLPPGYEILLPGSQAAFDPRSIGIRGGAQTKQDVANIVATAGPKAKAAGQSQKAIEDVKTAAIGDRARQAREQELASGQTKRTGALETKSDQFDLINRSIDTALSQSGTFTTGIVGAVGSNIPGTPAYDLNQTLQGLRANIGFDKLAELRANSPTGGALGSVSDRENELLQSVFGSLQQAQSRDQFETRLEDVRRQVKKSWERVNKAYDLDYGVPYFEASSEQPGGALSQDEMEELRQLEAEFARP